MIEEVAAALAEEATATNERRLLVLSGGRDAGVEAAETALDAAGYAPATVVFVGEDADLPYERVPIDRATTLLGSTHDALVLDGHDRLDPNAIGQTVGTVDGGGLYVLLAPPLPEWPDRRDAFDETLSVPPFGVEDVTGHFERRFVETLRTHPGIAIVDVDEGRLERDGLTDPPPRRPAAPIERPTDATFPNEAYEACLTGDQVRAVEALEALAGPDATVVVEADRGRGKSSAAGLAAASLAAAGDDVVLTAPGIRSAEAAIDRAEALIDELGERADDSAVATRGFATRTGGRLRFLPPDEAARADPDVLLVDEAAALPVARLSTFLSVGRVGFTTTIHGYEGAGRGFSVRFRETLAESGLAVTEVAMTEPVRYAAGDPVEVWSFRALLLDASPAAAQLVDDSAPESVEYRGLAPETLLADEPLLRQTFGLLVLAHYRTEPADLARLLDAPNVAVRALLHDGHVVAVALLAREGGLPPDLRAHMYEGGRVRGNMLPDVLTSQLRDEDAGVPVGQRVMRIATHAAVRSRGLGSHLLACVHEEFADSVDWLGTGFGATPRLLDFWTRNGFSTVHLSTSRNAASGEHSAIMLSPTSEAGRALHDRHANRFVRRIGPVLTDALAGIDPDVVRGALRSTDAEPPLYLDASEWRLVASAAYGPGLVDLDPGPFRKLAVRHLVSPTDPDALTIREERLLVLKVLQARGWGEVAGSLGFHSRRECMRALGVAYQPLVDLYGTDAAREERDRYR